MLTSAGHTVSGTSTSSRLSSSYRRLQAYSREESITSPPAALPAAASSELASMTRRGSTSRYSAHQGVQGYTLPICNTTAASLPTNARPKPHDDLAASARLTESIPGFALECRRFDPEKRGFAPGSNLIAPGSCQPSAWRRGRRSRFPVHHRR